MFLNKKNREEQKNKKNIKIDFLDSSFISKDNLKTVESKSPDNKSFWNFSLNKNKTETPKPILKPQINIPEEKVAPIIINKDIKPSTTKESKKSFFSFILPSKPKNSSQNKIPNFVIDKPIILDKIKPETIIKRQDIINLKNQNKELEKKETKKSFWNTLFSETKNEISAPVIKPKINIPEEKADKIIINKDVKKETDSIKTNIEVKKEEKKPTLFHSLFGKKIPLSEKKDSEKIASAKKVTTPDMVIAKLKKDGLIVDKTITDKQQKQPIWKSLFKKSKTRPIVNIKPVIEIPKIKEDIKPKIEAVASKKEIKIPKTNKIKKYFVDIFKKAKKESESPIKPATESIIKPADILPKKITSGTIISRIRAENTPNKPGFLSSLFKKSTTISTIKDKKVELHIPEEDRRAEWKKEIAENSKKPIIEATDVSITYNLGKANELHALKNANVKIYPGEYVIFFGPSGCGKSTLLFALAGLQAITKGTIIIDGLEISKTKASSEEMVNFHRTKIGIIFQAFFLIPSLNIFKNIGLPRVFLSSPKKERDEKVEALLKRFDIEAQAKKLPSQLSGGQQQRVAIARALVNDPKILFADEPVGNLDTKSSDVVLEILKQLNEEDGRTIILVTHDARHLSFANRVFHLKDGLIIKETVNNDIRPTKVKIEEEQKKPEVTGEMDLLLRTYSGLSSAQLSGMIIPYKAKQLVQDVLIGMSGDQIKNIEKTVEEYLMNIHSENYSIMEKTFDESLEKGGVGLDSRTAEVLTEKIKNVLEEIKYLKNAELAEKDYKVSGSPEKIQHLRKFLLEKYDIHIKDEETIKRLDEIIQIRLENKIDSYRLRKTLDKSQKLGGVGLDGRNAKKIAKEMELIMLLKFK